MTARVLSFALVTSFFLSASAQTSQPAAQPKQPLTSIPYSPSLDLTNLDRSADPCVDFYQFTCGGWMKNNPIPPDQAAWSVYAKLADENSQFLWGILEQDAKLKNRTPVQQKIGDYFAACMNTDAINARGLEPLKPELERINAISSRDQLTAFLREGANRRGLYFLDVRTDQDPKNAGMMIVSVGAGGLGLPDRDYYTKTDARSEEIRKRYVAYLAQLLVLAGVPQAQADEQAAATMKIETALASASLTRVERRNPYNLYHPMKIGQVDALAPTLDLSAYLQLQKVSPSLLDNINVSQPKFLEALQSQLASESLDNLKAYLRTHALNEASTSLSSDFEDAQFNFFGKFLRGIPQMQPRWRRCERQVDHYLGEALGQEFVARTFSADTKQKVLQMTEQIEQAMQEEIEHLDWMSEPTKKQALLKLHAVRNKIGYPDKWRDYSALTISADDYFGNVERSRVFEYNRNWAKLGKPVDRTEWSMTPPTVNAYYDPQTTSTSLPACCSRLSTIRRKTTRLTMATREARSATS
jgi:putative endopeptidase